MKIFVTGSNGLIGSEAVKYFGEKGYTIYGIDNNQRKKFFGKQGDTSWNKKQLKELNINFIPIKTDIRNRNKIINLYKKYKPDATIHCAAQPSHDLAAQIPFDDFETNATGTLNLLEASRRFTLNSPFLNLSTNKVYGDGPNYINLKEKKYRWEFNDEKYINGIDENFPIDQTKHSLFGASKVASDIMTQEYGKYFNMPTVCFRGGCLTGPAHSSVQLHGFLSYLVKSAINGYKYTVYGYKGKQVRDQIHSYDVVRAMEEFIKNPKYGEVYNLGGGKGNSASILECINILEQDFGYKLNYEISQTNRIGDHICYYSDISKLKKDYPNWDITISLKDIISQIVEFEEQKG